MGRRRKRFTLWLCNFLSLVGLFSYARAQEGSFLRQGDLLCATLAPEALIPTTAHWVSALRDSGYLALRLTSLERTPTGACRLCLRPGARYYLRAGEGLRPWCAETISLTIALGAKEALAANPTEISPQTRIRVGLVPSLDTIFPLHWQLFEGKPYPLADIQAHGEVDWSPRRWQSLLGYRLGAAFAHKELERVNRVLQSLPYLRATAPAALELLDTGAVRLHLFPELRRQNSIEGSLGFRPQGGGGKMTFWGNAHLHLQNLLRQGESLRGSWVGRGALRQDISLHTHFPYLWESAWGLLFSGQATLHTNDAYKWAMGGGISYRWGGWHELQMLIEQHRLHIADTATALRYWETAYTGRYLSPSAKRGYWKIAAGIGRRTSDALSSVEGRYQLELSYEQLWSTHWYLASLLHARGYLRTTAGSALEDFPFGGSNHFHGLEEQQITTPQYLYLTLRGGYQASDRLRFGLVSQVGELVYHARPRLAFSLGGEGLFTTDAGALEVGVARFFPWGGWYTAPGWLLHLRIVVTF